MPTLSFNRGMADDTNNLYPPGPTSAYMDNASHGRRAFSSNQFPEYNNMPAFGIRPSKTTPRMSYGTGDTGGFGPRPTLQSIPEGEGTYSRISRTTPYPGQGGLPPSSMPPGFPFMHNGLPFLPPGLENTILGPGTSNYGQGPPAFHQGSSGQLHVPKQRHVRSFEELSQTLRNIQLQDQASRQTSASSRTQLAPPYFGPRHQSSPHISAFPSVGPTVQRRVSALRLEIGPSGHLVSTPVSEGIGSAELGPGVIQQHGTGSQYPTFTTQQRHSSNTISDARSGGGSHYNMSRSPNQTPSFEQAMDTGGQTLQNSARMNVFRRPSSGGSSGGESDGRASYISSDEVENDENLPGSAFPRRR
ncbi:hypothetical protein TWF281_011641 [Arthrobotrys megalospora]